jgi:hypothetical protein
MVGRAVEADTRASPIAGTKLKALSIAKARRNKIALVCCPARDSRGHEQKNDPAPS